jgi:hypothetical protein
MQRKVQCYHLLLIYEFHGFSRPHFDPNGGHVLPTSRMRCRHVGRDGKPDPAGCPTASLESVHRTTVFYLLARAGQAGRLHLLLRAHVPRRCEHSLCWRRARAWHTRSTSRFRVLTRTSAGQLETSESQANPRYAPLGTESTIRITKDRSNPIIIERFTLKLGAIPSSHDPPSKARPSTQRHLDRAVR